MMTLKDVTINSKMSILSRFVQCSILYFRPVALLKTAKKAVFFHLAVAGLPIGSTDENAQRLESSSHIGLVDGFNPSEKYMKVKWDDSVQRMEK